MILLNANNFYQSPRVILNMYKNLLDIRYNTLRTSKNETILSLLRIFTHQEIEKAIEDIFLDKNNNIIIDSQSKSSVILRYLEYGGENVRSLFLLSNVKKDIERRSL